MKNLFKLSGILAVSALALTLAFTSSCKKDKPTTVKITVVDTDGARVKDCNVRLYGKSSQPDSIDTHTEVRFDQTQKTDASGVATYDLSDLTKPGQAGFVVLDIRAYKIDQEGLGTIRCEEEKTNEKTITIQ